MNNAVMHALGQVQPQHLLTQLNQRVLLGMRKVGEAIAD